MQNFFETISKSQIERENKEAKLIHKNEILILERELLNLKSIIDSIETENDSLKSKKVFSEKEREKYLKINNESEITIKNLKNQIKELNLGIEEFEKENEFLNEISQNV